MKKIVLFLSAIAVSFGIEAQVKAPQPSPLAKVHQVIGLTDVSVEYSRPSMKGRTIFGNLVPYDKLWRTGANRNTMITFGDDVKINGKELKKGSYAIFTKPSKDSWEVIFYTDTNNGGTPREWDDSKVALKATAKVKATSSDTETFTIAFSNLKMDGATMYFKWEKTKAILDIETPAKSQTLASIEKTMAGPSHGDHFQAAVFYKNIGEFAKAKEHIDKAVAGRKEPAFWYLRQQSLIYAKTGDKAGAIKAAKTSLELAEKAGNADYVKMNKDSLAEWGAK